MPARRVYARPKSRARRSARGTLARLAVLNQRQLDLLGLALIALGVLLGCVLYLGWSGGQAGEAIANGLAWLVGQLRYAAPAAFLASGALVIARPLLASARPLRAGGLCLLAASALALAAGTGGIGPSGARHGYWDPSYYRVRGGALGEALDWAATTLFSSAGAHILAIFLFLAALLLLSGATVAGVIQATRTHVQLGSERLRAATRASWTHSASDRAGTAELDAVHPPEPNDRELVVRAAHVEAPPLDGASQFADLLDAEDLGGEDGGDAPEVVLVDPDHGASDEVGGTADLPVTLATGSLTPQGRYRSSITDDPGFVWRVPGAKLLTRSTGENAKPDTAGQEKVSAQLLEALGHFGVQARVVGRVTGPHITRYELRLAPGTKVAKISQLKDDLAYALAATDIRILAPIPGKQAVGVEVPNARRRIVHLGDVHQDPPADWSPLTVWLGKDVAGRAIGADLVKMPHLLVAGTTGAGKSAAINAMLVSVLLRATPHDVRLVLVDPKQVELNHYDSIPHLLTPVITSPRLAANALGNLVREMEERYGMMSLARTRTLPELNRVRGDRGEKALPYVLCVIDELADLMMVAPADVEDSIIRLAQKARAVGIHLVLATQSPRVDVITGMIKANVPSRIAFAVSSQTDSRVILDQGGAESLLGQGDMLFSPVGTSRLQRIQGAYVDEEQIARITELWREQGEPELHEQLLAELPKSEDEQDTDEDGFSPNEDPLLEEAIGLVAQMQTASTSMLQRRLRLGYTRAGRLIDMLERRGIISGYEGSKPRQVLIAEGDVPRVLANLAEAGRGSSPVSVPGGAGSQETVQTVAGDEPANHQ
ncbi:MAG: DNA translocase FtsK [Solirubrobacterales bacterium]|nr:MAG: DNA translocase FtsK [Solirubrobacterales bacterium]